MNCDISVVIPVKDDAEALGLCLSFHLDPGVRVAFEPTLRVGMRSRAVLGTGGVLRLRRGIHTVVLHWPDQAPWKRWAPIFWPGFAAARTAHGNPIDAIPIGSRRTR